MEALFQGLSPAPPYLLLPKLPKTTTMLVNCIRFKFNYNPCFVFANGYPSSSSSSGPFSVRSRPRKPLSVIVNARKKDKKEDSHSFAPKPDEVTGFFPESVLLKKVIFFTHTLDLLCFFSPHFSVVFSISAIFISIVVRTRYPFEDSFCLLLLCWYDLHQFWYCSGVLGPFYFPLQNLILFSSVYKEKDNFALIVIYE